MIVRLFALLALVLCCSISYAEEVVEIPLSEIWGYNIPGTKDVRELEPDAPIDLPVHELIKKSANIAIQRKLSRMTKDVPLGFVVEGESKSALLAAREVFYDASKRKDSFSTDEKLTLVFFAGDIADLHFEPVKIEGNRISIHYAIIRPLFRNRIVTTHFALIPLGKLPAGKYGVVISPDLDIVCDSFQFEIKGSQE